MHEKGTSLTWKCGSSAAKEHDERQNRARSSVDIILAIIKSRDQNNCCLPVKIYLKYSTAGRRIPIVSIA